MSDTFFTRDFPDAKQMQERLAKSIGKLPSRSDNAKAWFLAPIKQIVYFVKNGKLKHQWRK